MGKIITEWDSSYPKFNVDSLKGPSDATKLYNKTERDFDSEKIRTLFSHYGWGFKYTPRKFQKKVAFRLLVKIVHYMASDLRPSQEDFERCNSDAGPGLLIPECGALPFSLNHPPPSLDQPMDEYLRKAMRQFPYRSLERSPSAFPILATAAKNSRIQPIKQGGIGGRYCGRGPAGNDSFGGALDCALVAAHLLDAGCTKADRVSPYWHSMLSELEKQFLELIWINWGDLSDALVFNLTSKLARESLLEHQTILKRKIIEKLKSGQMAEDTWSIKPVWESCTRSFHQFLVRYNQHRVHLYECGYSNEPKPFSAHYIPLKANREDSSKNTIQAQITSLFTDDYRMECSDCERLAKEKGHLQKPKKGDRTSARKIYSKIQRRFHELPLRLAFLADPKAQPDSYTTSNVVIDYRHWNDKWKRATYRWLGGIYPIKMGNGYRYTVFWNDNERYETDTKNLRRYDARECDGRIIEGFDSVDRSGRVPHSDWQCEKPTLLFYEKVLNLPKHCIQALQSAITRTVESVHQSESAATPPRNQTSSRGSPANNGAPTEEPQQGTTNPQGYPEDVVPFQPTNPQFKQVPQRQSPPPLGHLPSSRAHPPKKKQASYYEIEVPQNQGDAGQLYQCFPPGQQPDSYTSTQYPGGHQQRSSPLQQAQLDQPLPPGIYHSYPADRPVAPEPDISAENRQTDASQWAGTPEGLPRNDFDEMIANCEAPTLEKNQSLQQIPTNQTHGHIQSLNPRFPKTSSNTPTLNRNISPGNAAAPLPASCPDSGFSQRTSPSSASPKYFTDYLGYPLQPVDSPRPTRADADDQPYHDPPSQALGVNSPTDYLNQPTLDQLYAAPLSQPPLQPTTYPDPHQMNAGYEFSGYPETSWEFGPRGGSGKRKQSPEDEFRGARELRKRQRK